MKKVFTMYSEHLFTMYPVCTSGRGRGRGQTVLPPPSFLPPPIVIPAQA